MATPTENREIIARIHGTLGFWNSGDVVALADRFREDAVLCSPFASADWEPSVWLHGHDEILAHLSLVRSHFKEIHVVEIFTDTRFFSVLLSSEGQYLNFFIEPDETDNLIRRMIICRSVWKRPGATKASSDLAVT